MRHNHTGGGSPFKTSITILARQAALKDHQNTSYLGPKLQMETTLCCKLMWYEVLCGIFSHRCEIALESHIILQHRVRI